MPHELATHPIHLGLGAQATAEPEFSGMEWYEAYAARHQADGREGRLVSQYSFDGPWNVWEMHPHGDEVVICIAGELRLTQELGAKRSQLLLQPGQYAINGPGVWHTADSVGPCTAIFITAGMGTQHRPR